MIIRDDLHSLFDQLVALILETLAVAVFASVYTTAVVVVLRGR